MIEIRDRNTEQHQEVNSVKTDSISIYFPHAYIIHSKGGGGRQQTSLTWYKE